MFLYILKLDEVKAIKIGIATNNERIRSHLLTYKDKKVNLSESYIVKAKNQSDIKLLEQQLLLDYRDYAIESNDLIKRDGYTEIRCDSITNMILEDIQYKQSRHPGKEISINKGIKLKSKNNTKHKKSRCHHPSQAKMEKYNYFEDWAIKNYQTLDNWMEPIIRHREYIVSTEISARRVNIIFDSLSDEQVNELTENDLHYVFSKRGDDYTINGVSCYNLNCGDPIPPMDRGYKSEILSIGATINQVDSDHELLGQVSQHIIGFAHTLPNVSIK